MRALVDKVLKICEEMTTRVGACSRCGKCCKKPLLLPEDKERISRYLGISKESLEKYFLKDTCPFFSNNECKIYDIRPIICRIYPFILLPQGLFLTNIKECKLAHAIYEKLFPRVKEKPSIVKIPLTKLGEQKII